MIIVCNSVAVKPPQNVQVSPLENNGLSIISNRFSAIPLEVVFSGYVKNEFVSVGDFVVVIGDSLFQPWAKKIYFFEKTEFVLCPVETIIAIKKNI